MYMDKMGEQLFSQLRATARDLDQRLPELTRAVEQRQPFSAPKALHRISKLRKEVNDLKATSEAEIAQLRINIQTFQDITCLAGNLLGSLKDNVSGSQQYLQKYGYVPSETSPKEETPGSEEANTENVDVKAAGDATYCTQPSTPKQAGRPPGQRRTPKLEEFGISDSTIKALKQMAKKDSAFRASKPVTKPAIQEVPSPFQHNGFLCTPSLFPSSSDREMSEGHASLASPVHINTSPLETDENTDTMEDPRTKLGFDAMDSGSPKSPVLQTPGWKEMSTGDRRGQQGQEKPEEKAKASVSLFKSEQKEERKTYYYDDGEPQEPELTYSLEAIREMTGMYKINPKQLLPTTSTLHSTTLHSTTLHSTHHSTTLYSTDNKENTTPTEPELLSERVAKVNKEAAANADNNVKPRTLYGDMPESPKFMLNYDFIKK